MGIVGYGVAFRDEADFRLDEIRRRQMASPEGQYRLAKARDWETRCHRAALIVSATYRRQQQTIEDALKGISGDFAGDVLTAEEAIWAHIRSTQA